MTGDIVVRLRTLGAGCAVMLLSSCTMDLAVTGMLGQDEQIEGSVTHYDDGGTIEIFGAPGTHCVGSFLYQRMRQDQMGGYGKMICDDRRDGPFSFTLVGRDSGHGSGTLSGIAYHFRFGRRKN